jgi:uncharacterized protein (DUF3084 family)
MQEQFAMLQQAVKKQAEQLEQQSEQIQQQSEQIQQQEEQIRQKDERISELEQMLVNAQRARFGQQDVADVLLTTVCPRHFLAFSAWSASIWKAK